MAVPAAPEQITGRVVSVNPKGLKLAGHDTWINFSKYAVDVVPPMRGQTVTLTLDRQGFIRAVDASGGPQLQDGPRPGTDSDGHHGCGYPASSYSKTNPRVCH